MAAIGIEAQLCEALLQRLTKLLLSPALPVAYPDVAFTKPVDGGQKPLPYLEAALLPIPTSAATLNGWNSYTGILQVTVVYPQNAGAIKSQQIAAAIVAHFKRGTEMTDGAMRVRIVQPPSIGPTYPDAPYTRTPISVHYQAFARQVA